ncbi:DP-EP family protein [Alteromonas gracilis]|uniref:DP-EP family protein n=1 Tax=Alteromonas gracilis TaxID=1479524 RepID=UPI0030D45A73
MTTPPNYNYSVTVSAEGAFTITPEGNAPESPIKVTVPNTTITYTLTPDTAAAMVFLAPEISNDPEGDLTWEIVDSGRSIVITDSDADDEDCICVKLVAGFVSPDPEIQNKPT